MKGRLATLFSSQNRMRLWRSTRFSLTSPYLYRFTWGEIVPSFLMGTSLFLMILLMAQAIRLSEFLVSNQVNFKDIFLLCWYLMWSLVGTVIPVAYLFSVLIGISRAHSEGETTALQVSGVSLVQAFGPVAVLSLIVTLVSVYFSMYPVPHGNRKFELMITRLQQEKVMEALKPGVFINGFHGLTLYAEQVIPAKNEMRRVFLFDDREETHPMAITAKKAVILSNPYEGLLLLRLSDGSVYEDTKSVDEDLLRIDFEVHDINLSHAPLGEAWREYSPLSFNYHQIKKRLIEIEGDPVGSRSLQVEFHRRVSLGFSCFIFGALGFFLSLLSQKGVRGGAILFCTVAGIFYWLFLVAANAIAVRGWGAPWVVVWIPNLIFAVVAFLAYRRASR